MHNALDMVMSIFWKTRERAASTAFTAHTGSRVSPTRNVTSHSSGIEARNFMSSARPDLFSNVERSGSASAMPESGNTSGIATIDIVDGVRKMFKTTRMCNTPNSLSVGSFRLARCQTPWTIISPRLRSGKNNELVMDDSVDSVATRQPSPFRSPCRCDGSSQQLARVVVLEQPPLRFDGRIAVLHDQLVLRLVNRQTAVGRAVPEQVRVGREVPVLVAARPVTRVEYDVVTCVVQTRFIPPDLSRFAQHPRKIFHNNDKNNNNN
uniref:Uncharacterized protein n=1 Tax=Anopheles atroparvus TaxID=41427 RepID=A0A182J450_ANOAO